MAVAKVFLDTNVLVYANDSRDAAKQQRAIELVTSCMRDGSGVVSTQVLQEYAVVALERLHQRLEAVLEQLRLLETLEVVQVTPALIRRGLEFRVRHQVSYWDAAILAAAESAGCARLWSEDLAAGAEYGSVRVENPFLA